MDKRQEELLGKTYCWPSMGATGPCINPEEHYFWTCQKYIVISEGKLGLGHPTIPAQHVQASSCLVVTGTVVGLWGRWEKQDVGETAHWPLIYRVDARITDRQDLQITSPPAFSFCFLSPQDKVVQMYPDQFEWSWADMDRVLNC